MIFAAMDGVLEIHREHVLNAHTLLYATEQRMPKALGQFGRARTADVANSIIEIIRSAPKVLSLKEIWIKVSHDLEKYEQFLELMKKLEQTEKVKYVKHQGKQGYIASSATMNQWKEEWLVQEKFLLPEERIIV